jgi:hypothetical protein
MSRLGKTAESLLSDVFIKLVISAAIGQRHLHESIFRLLRKNLPIFQRSRCKDTKFIFGTDRICPNLTEFVRICQFLFCKKLA